VESRTFDGIESLRRQAFERQAKARGAVRAYNRATWMRFAAVFIPVPLVVVLFRLHLDAWHYYILGGAFIVIAVLMYALDGAAVTKRDNAIEAAKAARTAYRQARTAARRTT